MKTIIEAGHYYQVNGPSELSITGWEVGKEMAAHLPEAELALFIDDFHQTQPPLDPEDTFLDPDAAVVAAAGFESVADHVFSEAAFAVVAPQKAASLQSEGLVKVKKGILSAGGIRLGCLRWQ
jgi:hypothetical protein